MGKTFSLPKFTSPEQRKKKWLKWGLIVGGGLVLVQMAVLTVVAANRKAEADRQAAERARSAQVVQAAEQAAERARQELLAKAPPPVAPVEEPLPPRAEGDAKPAPKAVSGAGKSRSRSHTSSKKGRGSKEVAAGATDKKAARKADAIDALLGQFR